MARTGQELIFSQLMSCLATEGISQSNAPTSTASRLQTVLLKVVGHCTSAEDPNEQNLRSTVKFLSLLAQTYPVALCGSDCWTALSLIAHILPLFTKTRLSRLHGTLAETVSRMTLLVCEASFDAAEALLGDLWALVCDLKSVLQEELCLPLNPTPEAFIRIRVLRASHQHIHKVTEGVAEAATAPDVVAAKQSADAGLGPNAFQAEGPAIDVQAASQCQALLRALIKVLTDAYMDEPELTGACMPARMAHNLLHLFGAGFSVQTAAMGLLGTVFRDAPPDALLAKEAVASLLAALTFWHCNGPWKHALLQEWCDNVVAFAESLIASSPGEVLQPLVRRFAADAGKTSVPYAFRASICKLLVKLAEKGNMLQQEVFELVKGLPAGLPCSELIWHVLGQLRESLGTKALESIYASLQNSQAEGSDVSNLRKRRRTSSQLQDVVNLCSPESGTQASLLEAEEMQTTRKPRKVPMAQRQYEALAIELLALADKVALHADGQLGAQERLIGLQGLLLSTGGAIPTLLARVSPVVGEWVTWCLSAATDELRLRNIAAVTGCIELFFLCCLNLEVSSPQGCTPSRSASRRSKAKELAQSTGLTKEQLKSLMQLPFSPTLGLDATFSASQGAECEPPEDPELLRATKLSSLRAHCASHLFETDHSNPLARGTPLAKAVADSDAHVRAAAVYLIPSHIICAQSPKTVLQSAIKTLQKLAEDEEGVVKLAVASCVAEVTRISTLRDQKAETAMGCCIQLVLKVGQEPFDPAAWTVTMPPRTPSPATGTDLTLEEVEGFAAMLLHDEAVDSRVRAMMLRAVVSWLSAASEQDAKVAHNLYHGCLQQATSATPLLRLELLHSAEQLSRPHLVQGIFSVESEMDQNDSTLLTQESSLLKALKAVKTDAHEEAIQITFLMTFAAIGKCLRGSAAEFFVLANLIDYMCGSNPSIQSVASKELEKFAASRRIKLQTLVLENSRLVAHMGRLWLEQPSVAGYISHVLEMTEESVAEKLLPDALSVVTEEEDRQRVQALAGHMRVTPRELLHEFGGHVVAKFLYKGKFNDSIHHFMDEFLEGTFLSFLNSRMQEVIMATVEEAGNDAEAEVSYEVPDFVYDRAITTLQALKTIQSPSQQCADAAAFLAESDHVIHILKSYGDTLSRATQHRNTQLPSAEVKQQQRVLRCVVLLIRLTGRFVPRFLPQIMVLLSSSVRAGCPGPVKLQALEAWHTLVQTLVGEDARVLASIMNQVVVTLLEPLQEGGNVMAAAVKVLDTLVIQNRDKFKAQIKTLPPLPQSVPALEKVKAVITEERGRLGAREQVQLLLPSLGRHHSLSVRATALQELRDCLNRNRQWLAGLLASSTSAASQDGQVAQSALLCSLMSALLKGCDSEAQSPNGVKAQQLCAECLGMLGAIDPARLNVKAEPPSALHSTTLDLLKDLISIPLVRLLRVAPNMQVLDATTFAIQELLRKYGVPQKEPPQAGASGRSSSSGSCEQGSISGKENTLFARLSKDVQVLVQPYLATKYTVTGSSKISQGRVFTTGTPFRQWLPTWLRQLILQHAAGELLPLFQACGLVMQRDVQTCMYLMPYVIHNVLLTDSNSAKEQVREEIVAVLTEGHTNKEGELCIQAIFSLLDMLKKFVTDLKREADSQESSASSRSASQVSSAAQAEQKTRHITELIDSIALDLLAQAAFRCGAYARALQYFESYVRAKEKGALNPAALISATYTDEEVTFLQELYAKLEEPDSLAGLMWLRQGRPRLQDQILEAEKLGEWTEALSLYEISSRTTSAAETQKGLNPSVRGQMHCLLQMGHLQGMLLQTQGLSRDADDVAQSQLAAIGTAGAWRLGRWRELSTHLNTASRKLEVLNGEEIWEIRIGSLLSGISGRDRVKTTATLEEARKAIMAPLSAASMESYTRAYPFLVKLHMLQELSDAAVLLQEGCVAGPLERQRRLRWQERLNVTQSSLAVQEPILALRRQLAQLSGAQKEASLCWLQHAKICRATGNFEAATLAVQEALAKEVPGAQIEHARLLWETKQPRTGAIIELEQYLKAADEASRQPMTQLGPERKEEITRSKTQMLLQLAQWTEMEGQGDYKDVKGLFDRAIALESKSEQCYFHLAKYLDQLMQDARLRQEAKTSAAPDKAMDRIGGKSRIQIGKDQPYIEYVPHVIRNYGSAVRSGYKHIYQALPRLLTVWFEFGSYYNSLDSPSRQAKEIQRSVHEAIQQLFKEVGLFVWLLVLPQLTSRICHPHKPTQNMTQHILTRLTAAYPQQALWALIAVSKSKVPERNEAASTIIRAAKNNAAEKRRDGSGSKEEMQLYTEFPAFCDQIIRLCHHKPADRIRAMSAKSEMSVLVRMMPLGVLMPTNGNLGLVLPSGSRKQGEHQPFASAVTIESMKDRIDVMQSLQKPKKIVFIGSDGKEYAFLAKTDDDLRKDSRMMETAGLLNRLFAKEPVSRRRNLYIRRFAVTPLTEECGLIEWVPHTRGLRQCCERTYMAAGILDSRKGIPTIKAIYESFKGKRMKERLEKVLAVFNPPLLHQFFLATFPEPASWHNARLAFTRTTAVWAMVGHIMGLGDRHGENILVDSVTGDCVHIDFACLFDKGLTLATPEVVPFRLTQNVIDAFGVSGYEGTFRTVAETTLRVLRDHRDALASVLETFVHDPLLDWTRNHGSAPQGHSENPQAKDAMATIQGRLAGTLLGVRSSYSRQLSVEGQVQKLIEEATDKENLGLMYIWWMPWY